MQFSLRPPDDELVTNIHVIGFADGGIVVCRDARREGHWFLPGGTREQGESVEECVRRELAEEAGASLVGPLHWLGAHFAETDRPRPGYEWQPHPYRAWLWCTAELRLDGEPSNPEDGEQVAEVRAAPPEEAVRLIAASEGEEFGQLVQLALESHESDASRRNLS
ncbi:NUDIX hydrolase [Mangrovactinospora gilvigrisea]|uniref:NUDIX hydrolase n=1 Tax=Mangrovactinospora gilvigrisea TaxID=1428644 RepID=UPI001FEB05EA|nr:NUDIX domain-containing protein [Mangrovactinospora gilvigrisea]